MARRVATVTALLLVITRVSGDGQPSFFFSGVPAPAAEPQFYVYDTQLVAVPVAPDPARSAAPLPCPAEGFYRHPTDCSRFYRCVDYAGTGQYFSRYEFQCPPGQMFLSVGKDTCVPADCAGAVPVPAPISPVDPGSYGPGGAAVPPSTGQVGDDPGSYPQPGTPPHPIPIAGGAYPQPGGSPPAGSVGVGAHPTQSPATEAPTPPVVYPEPVTAAPPPPAYPQPVTAPPTPPVVYPEPVTAAPPPPVVYPEPVTPAPTPPPPPGPYPQPDAGTGACPARYVQDSQFCNIYHRCPDDQKRYLCIAGTVFDQARQMCRLNDQEDVCLGKKMFSTSPAFRADFPLLNQGGPAQLIGGQAFPSFSQGQTFPTFRQGQTFPTFRQGQTFPEFRQGQTFPVFSQGQALPLFSEGQYFPSFDQGQTFQSFDQVQNFPEHQPLIYSVQFPSHTEVSGVPQFVASDFNSGQDTKESFFAQPGYAIPNYYVSSQ